jgi:hypothetical protein
MKKKAKGKKATSKSKADDFVSVARRLGADEDKDRFEARLGKIARGSAEASKLKSKRSR